MRRHGCSGRETAWKSKSMVRVKGCGHVGLYMKFVFLGCRGQTKVMPGIRQGRCHIGMQGELGLDPAGYAGLERGLCVHVGGRCVPTYMRLWRSETSIKRHPLLLPTESESH